MADGLDQGDRRAFRTMQVRSLTSLGNVVNLPVTVATSTVTVSFGRSEAQPNYGVNVTANWLTTVRVTTKTVNSFVVDFGVAAPANAVIDIQTFRSE